MDLSFSAFVFGSQTDPNGPNLWVRHVFFSGPKKFREKSGVFFFVTSNGASMQARDYFHEYNCKHGEFISIIS